MEIPIVFISSTYEDLIAYRIKARDAVAKMDCLPKMMEYFEAGGNPPLKTCLEKVRSCDLLIVVVAHRYGWIPKQQEKPNYHKSITWLECEAMLNAGKKVLTFLVDEKCKWPDELKDSYELVQALEKNEANIELFKTVNLKTKRLLELKEWLKNETTPAYFTNPDSLESAVLLSLHGWQKEKGKEIWMERREITEEDIPIDYLNWLMERCTSIELKAHLAREGCAPPRLSSVYVPTPTAEWRKEKLVKSKKEGVLFRKNEGFALLLERLADESLYVSGIAGCGKSTFAKWVAYLICSGEMPEQIQMKDSEKIVENFPDALKGKMPVLVLFREFWPFLEKQPGRRSLNRKEFETVLKEYIETKFEGLDWRKTEHYIDDGKAILLFDGVDEIPISSGENKDIYYPREMILDGLKSCIPSWKDSGNRVLLTSRPYGVTEADEQQLGLERSEIIELPQVLQQLFMKRWFIALAYGEKMADEMIWNLAEREELTELTGNTVMLMAMCILYPEGGRLPQDKAELYHLTIDRILYNRYRDPVEVDKAHLRLSVIAHGMHTGEGLGEQRKMPLAVTTKNEIDRMLQFYLEQQTYTERGFTSVAEVREELLSRSGLLIQRGDLEAAFYHLSFQDYLAAKRLMQLAGDNLHPIIDEHADVSEWRQTLAFVFGILLREKRSPEKNIQILTELIDSVKQRQWVRLALLGDFFEIIYAKGYEPAQKVTKRFIDFCKNAIEEKAPLAQRFDLGRALGIVGDPRVAVDLRKNLEAYVLIPKGKLTLGETGKKETIDESFYLSKYPVTNAQYRLFVEEDGYRNEKWWSKEGKEWRDKNNISEPQFWKQGRWNGPNFPVVGVSWYEAKAFCAWAGGRLPSEMEWNWAAYHAEREHPWGKGEPKKEEANFLGLGLNRTTPVGLFPAGATPDGLMDMAGNVWEWCEDCDYEEVNRRVVRGGAFTTNAYGAPALECGSGDPYERHNHQGFRVLRVPSH
ncbi:DUF4062 domain-containing protein [candidate division KSB1 bacterium]|nr:MAG: DUF4062 domain-containing protein [candidate division KSB1 bacterium]